MNIFWALLILLLIVMVCFLLWYISKMLKKYLYFSNNIQDIFEILDNFSLHLKQLNEMEIYHGEPVLENLINHTKAVVNEVETFKNECLLSLYDNDEEMEEFDQIEEKE